jgi:hypothetical protein
MGLAEKQIWEDVERVIFSHQGKMLGSPNGIAGVTMDTSLVYRAGVLASLASFRGNNSVLRAIAKETKVEGRQRKLIERLGLLNNRGPHSLSRALYIVWDTAETLMHPMLCVEERLEIREDPEPIGTVAGGSVAPRRSVGAERMEDVLGDWTKSPETSNKGPWLNWRDRKDLTTSTRSDGPSLAVKRSQIDDDSGIKAMRLEDPVSLTMPREQMEVLTMADRLGETGLDSASRSTTSSRPEWETVQTHKSMGKTALGGNKAWKREWISRGPGTRPRECRPTKRRLQSRAASGRMGATDEEVLMVVESQATRLSELDDRNRSIMMENTEIKLVLLKIRASISTRNPQSSSLLGPTIFSE